MSKSKDDIGTLLFHLAVGIAIIYGYIHCIVNAANCNWEPIGKAEVAYTIGCLIPPVGVVLGYVDILDK